MLLHIRWTTNAYKAIIKLILSPFSPLSINLADLAEFFLTQRAAFGERGLSICDKTQTPERRATLKAL